MVRRIYSVDVYLRVRRAVMVEGRSIREVSREFGLHRDTVRKMLAYCVPPGYRRQTPPRRPKLEPFTGVIDTAPCNGDYRPELVARRPVIRPIKAGRSIASAAGCYLFIPSCIQAHCPRSTGVVCVH